MEIPSPRGVIFDWNGTLIDDRLSNLSLMKNSLKLIQLLHKKRIPISIVSNSYQDKLVEQVKLFKIKDYFTRITGIEDSEYIKPHPDTITRALEGTGIDPRKDTVWFIGDTTTDVICAKNSSCFPIVYGDGMINYDNEEFYRIKSYSEIIKCLL